MDVLVTGGAGYIGSVVTAQLLRAGHRVVVLDDLSRGHTAAVPHGARLAQADLLDLDVLRRLLAERFDAVMHFAALALVSESTRRPERYWGVNAGGTRNLLDAMRETQTSRLVFSSTCAVYGQPDEAPISETAPTRPTNPYGASKLAADWMISDEAVAHGLGAISLRYFNAAGASGGLGEAHEPETHLVPLVLQAALGARPSVEVYGTDYPTPDGTAVRDYVHVEDIAEAHRLALERTSPGAHRVFNLGNGAGYSVREVIEAAREVTGRPIKTVEGERRPGDPAVLVADNQRARDELGWAPRQPELRSMLTDAWRWLQAHPARYERPLA